MQGKWVRHRCGYQLWAEVLHQLWDQAVVNYRTEAGMIVFVCPGCHQVLQLWWDVPEGHMVSDTVIEQPWDGVTVSDWE